MAELSVTPADVVVTSTTTTATGTAGATITAGMAIYIDAAASNAIKPCDADVLASSVCVGIALHGAASGQPIKYATGGDITFSTMVVGRPYFVSQTTPGSLCVDSDLLTGDFITFIGIASTATNLKLKINSSSAARP